MKQLKILFACLLVIGSIASVWVAQTRGQAVTVPNGPINVYPVKFLCGAVPPTPQGQIERGPVKPGNYLTAINIHNPYFNTTSFFKKAVLMYSNDPTFQQGFEIPRKPGDLFQATLGADFGMEIDCDDIRQVLLKGILPPTATGFIKGWVIIEVPAKKIPFFKPSKELKDLVNEGKGETTSV